MSPEDRFTAAAANTARQRDALELELSTERARVEMLKAALLKLRDLVSRLITITPTFSDDPMADSSIRNDLLRKAVSITDSVVSSGAAAYDMATLLERVKVLEAALRKLGSHSLFCPQYPRTQIAGTMNPPCDCGYDAALSPMMDGVAHVVAPDGGCLVKCPRCTRIGPHRLEAGQPILFCAQCGIGEGVKVRFVIVPTDGHPLADAFEANEGPMGTQPEGDPKGPVQP